MNEKLQKLCYLISQKSSSYMNTKTFNFKLKSKNQTSLCQSYDASDWLRGGYHHGFWLVERGISSRGLCQWQYAVIFRDPPNTLQTSEAFPADRSKVPVPLVLVTGGDKNNSYSNQLKLSWVWKFWVEFDNRLILWNSEKNLNLYKKFLRYFFPFLINSHVQFKKACFKIDGVTTVFFLVAL